eukprot:m.731740 g.731740  ORF g.731740 m.731740 type:complete len:305 (-) comp23062_c1_seq3:99-1013(-)
MMLQCHCPCRQPNARVASRRRSPSRPWAMSSSICASLFRSSHRLQPQIGCQRHRTRSFPPPRPTRRLHVRPRPQVLALVSRRHGPAAAVVVVEGMAPAKRQVPVVPGRRMVPVRAVPTGACRRCRPRPRLLGGRDARSPHRPRMPHSLAADHAPPNRRKRQRKPRAVRWQRSGRGRRDLLGSTRQRAYGSCRPCRRGDRRHRRDAPNPCQAPRPPQLVRRPHARHHPRVGPVRLLCVKSQLLNKRTDHIPDPFDANYMWLRTGGVVVGPLYGARAVSATQGTRGRDERECLGGCYVAKRPPQCT